MVRRSHSYPVHDGAVGYYRFCIPPFRHYSAKKKPTLTIYMLAPLALGANATRYV
jgi:hypothetical protein